MNFFSAKIKKIGINPYVLLPTAILKNIFREACADKGAIPVRGQLNRKAYLQTLVKYSGKWRLYLNTPMREAAGIDVGDTAHVTITYDPRKRTTPLHPKLKKALAQNKAARTAFEQLSPSRQKEIARYINSLKTRASVDKNVTRAIGFLLGENRFVGRDNRPEQ